MKYAPEVSKQHGRVHFCGEHTAVANRGMEARWNRATVLPSKCST